MSLLSKGSQLEYLLDYREGKIKKGLGINAPALDKHFLFKKKELTLLLGHDNVGKTFFISFYALCLAVIHGIKWCIWSGENGHGQIYRDMIKMLSGRKYEELELSEIRFYSTYIEQYFDFVDNRDLYKPDQLLKIFDNSGADACLIDPFTGLDRGYEWSDNYRFLNEARHFINSTGISLFINTHPVSSAGRSVYPESHVWSGHIKAPLKDEVEGGKPFINRTDNVVVIHRLTKHEEMKYYTLISVDKIKDQDTGGEQTMKDNPILAEFNAGLGFRIGGIEPLRDVRMRINKQKGQWEIT